MSRIYNTVMRHWIFYKCDCKLKTPYLNFRKCLVCKGKMVVRRRKFSCLSACGILALACLVSTVLNVCLVMVRTGRVAGLPLPRSQKSSRSYISNTSAQVVRSLAPSPNPSTTKQPINISALKRKKSVVDLAVVEQQTDWFLFAGKCAKVPINLFAGHGPKNMTPTPEDKLIHDFPDVRAGHYSPRDCTPEEKLAIIIPFRDRAKHLYTLLPCLFTMLIRQGADFTVFLVEQDLPESFNKGVVYNAGFLEALKMGDFDCFIFHDVDMLPLNDMNMYRCEQRGPLHFVAGVNKFRYKLLYGWLIGGVVGFTRQQYEKVNGFSNLYFGWGSEDDDMRYRIISTNQTMYRRPTKVGYYDMIRHMRDKRWRANVGRFGITKTAAKRTQVDGLNSVKYTLTHMEKKPLFVHIRIVVKMSEVFDTAPGYMKSALASSRLEDMKNRIKEGTVSGKVYV